MLPRNTIKIIAVLTGLLLSSKAIARDYIQMVGSSTVYPFATVIAEDFKKSTKFKTPIVESTGTGGGFKLFCTGVGEKFPDFVNSSRAIEKSETANCTKNGVKSIVEIKIGYDGIVLANSNKSKMLSFTKAQIFLALADQIPVNGKLVKNPNKKWSDIDKSLPNTEIIVYGPPTTSGTRDAFVELVMEKACVNLKEFIAAFLDEKARKKACHTIRSDNKFIEAGENDNLIVQKLKNNPDAIGIFGFSFLAQNSSNIQGIKINNIMPNFEAIYTGKYEVSRPLFIYYKKDHATLVPGISDFVKKIVDTNTIGEEGSLVRKGLVPMHQNEYKKVKDKVLSSL